MALDRFSAPVRAWFEKSGFIEVETATLAVSPGNETHIQAFKTEMLMPGRRDRRYLRTSPEFACKKLLSVASSNLRASSATASAGRCIIRSLP